MNMKKLSGLPILTLMIIIITITFACTKKDNLTGDNWSGIGPQIAIADSFNLAYSYTHEGSVKGTEGYIICGSEDDIEAISVLRFTGLQEEMTVIEQPTLKIVATRRSPLETRSPLELSFHKLNQNWAPDSTDLISDANIIPLDIPDYVVADSVSSLGDTLTVNISADIIQNWETTDVTGFNLVIKAEEDGWLEFKANEIANGALLTFKYRVPDDTTTYTYNQRAYKDSYRITGTQDNLEDDLKLKNLRPQRMYLKYTLPNTIFIDTLGVPLNTTDRQRMTINKAELILFVKDNPYYNDVVCYFYPYRVKKDTLAVPTVMTDSDLEAVAYTYSSGTKITADSVKIDITAITQGFTSADLQNNGIVIKNNAEMMNFGNVEFWHYSDAPAGKKPYVKIYYTIPFLKGD